MDFSGNNLEKNFAVIKQISIFGKRKNQNIMEELTTEVTEEDIKNGVEDEFGVVYSRDGKRLLYGRNLQLECYDIKVGTEEICDDAFIRNDLTLRQITIPDTVTIIGFRAFGGCECLQRISIPNSVTKIGNEAFWGCLSLKQINIPNSVLSIGEKFLGDCKALEQITIPNSVTKIGNEAFEGCLSLKQIIIPNSVTKIGDRAFLGCLSLKQINIPNSVSSIGEKIFEGCEALEQITIPNSVTKIGNEAFGGCLSLKQINIPNSVTSIGDSAFIGCIALQQITIPDSVTMIGKNPFVACHNLYITSNSSRFVIDNDYLTDNYNVIISYLGNVDSIVITNTITTIGDSTFQNSNCLKYITIPDSVTTVGDNAFEGCSSLQQINIPDSVTTIGDNAFEGCSSLQQINIPDSVTTIGDSAFFGCSSLQQINIPDSVTTIGDGAFANCSSLQQVNIPDSVATIGDYVFWCCSSLQQINIPDSVTTIGDNAFEGCSSLQQINIPNSVITIGDGAFSECSALQQISIPNPVTTIGNCTFLHCELLKQSIISDLVSRVREDDVDRIVFDKLRIKKVRIKNFRAFVDEEISLNDFNCIIGKNDTGKTTILAALEWFFDIDKELNEKDLNSGNSYFIEKLIQYESETPTPHNISVEVFLCDDSIKGFMKKNNDYLDNEGCYCFRKKMSFSIRNSKEKSDMGYTVKKFIFKQMGGKAISDCTFDELVLEYKKISSQPDEFLDKIQQIEINNTKKDKDCIENYKIEQQIRERLYQYYSNSEREEQYFDIECEDRREYRAFIRFINSYKLNMYTSNTSLNNYLNDLLKIKYSASIEDTKSRMAKDLSKMLADNSVSESIRFDKNETIDLFNNDSLLLSSGNIPLNNRGEGIQLKIKIAVFKILTGIKSESHNTIFAFEEPETHLHPSAQIEMYETIKKLSENPNYQVIITTHSPYIVKQLAKDNINPIVVKRDEKLKVSKISRLDERVLPYVSMNEMNYIAFDEPSIEYHIELFGFIQQKTKKNPGGVDSWLLENKYAKREYDYYQVDANSQLIPDKKGGFQHSDKTLPYCVRNQIDHPNDINKQYENRDYIRRSIDIMRNAILNNPDIFQKKE